jgi:hypothetical protein
MNFSFKLCLVEKISVSPEKSQSSLCFGVQQYHYRGMPHDLRLRSEKLSPKPSPYCSWHSNPKLASQSFSNLNSSSVIKDGLSWSPCLGMSINLFIRFVLQGPGGQMGEIEIQMTHAAIWSTQFLDSYELQTKRILSRRTSKPLFLEGCNCQTYPMLYHM